MAEAQNLDSTGLLLSGGIDSAVLLDWFLARNARVVPFYVQTGCVWETCELNAVRQFLQALAHPRLMELVQIVIPLEDLYANHWSMTGAGVPSETSADAAVFLPGRNPLLLLKPALWCWMRGIDKLALGTLSGNPFSDATPQFFDRFERMLAEVTGGKLQIVRPFDHMPKQQVLEMGRHLPLGLTFSCLAPVAGLHCGECNKCAERRRAFELIGIDDPTHYAMAGQQKKAVRAAL